MIGELITNVAVLSGPGNDNQGCKEWRLEVAYRMLLLLRTSMAVIDYPTDFIAAWDVPELQGEELQDIQHNMYLNPSNRFMVHEDRSPFEESMRVPIRISYLLKKSLHKHAKVLNVPVHFLEYLKLLNSVDDFMTGYYG